MRRVLLFLLLAPLFFSRAYAEELPAGALDIFGAQAMQVGLSEEERAVGGEISGERYDALSALSRLGRAFVEKLRGYARAEFGFALRLMALVFLCGGARSACTVEKTGALIEICAACAAAGLLIGDVNGIIEETTGALYRLSDYSKAALPVVYAAAAASGAVASSAARYAASTLALDVMMSLAQRAVIPLIYAALSLSLANAVFPSPILLAVESFVRWAAKTCMTAACLAFTAYLGVSSAISVSADAAAIKATRSLISGALPVVGGMISDASAAVLSAAAVVKTCAGALGLVSVCALCVGPFALLSVKHFLFKAVAAAAESVQNPRLQRLLKGVGGAMALLMGLLGSCAVMLFLSLSLAMKAVTA